MHVAHLFNVLLLLVKLLALLGAGRQNCLLERGLLAVEAVLVVLAVVLLVCLERGDLVLLLLELETLLNALLICFLVVLELLV